MRKLISRYQSWQGHVRLSTPFVILCGGVAVVYLFYRITLLVFPAVALEQAAFRPGMQPAVCHHDTSRPDDPAPLISASYQRRIQAQKPAGPNLVKNARLTKKDATGQPAGYGRTREGKGITYGHHANGTPFLRVTTKKEPTGTAPTWQMERVPVKKDAAYAYSFWYRGTTPVEVTLEHQAKGTTQYAPATTLPATDEWRQFTAHFDNDVSAKSLRVSVAPARAGRLDMRGFDVHRINDARLTKGIVSVTFDDGWQSVADKAAPLLEHYGVRTTQYVISGIAGTTPDYMNFAELMQLKKHGHEIGSHSLTHCDQTTLSATGLRDNAIQSKRLLEEQNLGPIKSFAYPLGQYDAKTQDIYEKHYPLVRTSDAGYNDRYFDEVNIRSFSVLATTSDKELRDRLRHAEEHRLWVVLAYHRVDAEGEYNVSSAQLDRHLQLVRESGLDVLPLGEAAAATRQGQ